mmetsp:Transcript_19387/g.27286  ORF Transcript_19387/g.27286 Transcript_19387/m.27286 type:complete len:142 (+) Transcript_19387:93-518(+)
MKTPSCVVWPLIKRHNAFLVKRKGYAFTKDPLSTTNLHNASQSGISNPGAVSVQARREAAKKTHRRVFDVKIRHGGHHSNKNRSGAVLANVSVKKEINRLAKVLGSIDVANKDKLMKRVQRLHAANSLHQKKNRRIQKRAD